MSNQSAVNNLRAQYTQSQNWLEGTMTGVDDEIAHAVPDGLPATIAGQVAHIITGIDLFVIGIAAGRQPLMTGDYAEKSGMSEPPPEGGGFGEWGRSVRLDLPVFHEYAKAVFAEADSYLSSITDDDLAVEREFGGAGTHPVVWALNIILLNTFSHTGEIACLKGLRGLKGYPF